MAENVHYSFLLEYCRLEQSPRISPFTRLRNFTRQSGPDNKSSIPKPIFFKKKTNTVESMSNLFGTKNSQWKDPNRTRTEETRRRWLNQISCPPGMMTLIIDHPIHKPEKPNEQKQSEKKFQKKQITVSSRRGETDTQGARERERERACAWKNPRRWRMHENGRRKV